ncbi:barstar family protein [Sedimentibacter sp. zth1]|uniref:barstar family protein n=1 Tax=Sedimentibacter sp. zth1 TaxID=2816908 RepID=UPI001A92D2C0|nr:barstar family protein [Sedimentibacter sp. zth1]QSX06727.1 barstar family protein [Sedimentibacter sp. zth1]
MKIDKLIGLKEPFVHEVYCNWYDLESNMNFKEGSYIAIVDGNKCKSTDEVFVEFAKAFEFPDYLGDNWAAFDECINDLDWITSGSYVLIIKNSNYILETEPKDFEILLEILKDTAIEWAKGRNYDDFPTEPTPFHVIFHSEEVKKVMLNERLSEVLSSSDFDEIEI